MDIKRSGSQPSGKGQAEYFTGNSSVGRDLVRAGGETLARCRANYGHDAHRHSGTPRWQDS